MAGAKAEKGEGKCSDFQVKVGEEGNEAGRPQGELGGSTGRLLSEPAGEGEAGSRAETSGTQAKALAGSAGLHLGHQPLGCKQAATCVLPSFVCADVIPGLHHYFLWMAFLFQTPLAHFSPRIPHYLI